jgi:hypothetical protein
MDIADGLVKVKTRSNNSWEEYSYGPDASLGLVMQDLHETHYANYLSVGSNKISFMRIKKNILIINMHHQSSYGGGRFFPGSNSQFGASPQIPSKKPTDS